MGRQEFYANVADFEELGRALAAFPRHAADEVRFDIGKRDAGWTHRLLLRVHLYDAVGHAALLFEACNNAQDPWREESRFTIRCQVASLNRLGSALVAWAKDDDERLRAELTPIEA